jgi:hypothetical protein
MKRQPALLCAAILASLAAIHVHWARGGTTFSKGTVPTRPGTDEPVFLAQLHTSPTATMAVAVGLAFAAIAVLRAGFTGRGKGAARVVAIAFSLRAVGDFRYLGFTKRVKDTDFARRDSRIYSPLCMVIASLAGSVAR